MVHPRLIAAVTSAVAAAALAGPTVLPASAATKHHTTRHHAKTTAKHHRAGKTTASATSTPADPSGDPSTGVNAPGNDSSNPVEYLIQSGQLLANQIGSPGYASSVLADFPGFPPYTS